MSSAEKLAGPAEAGLFYWLTKRKNQYLIKQNQTATAFANPKEGLLFSNQRVQHWSWWKENNGPKMTGLKGTKSDDFINAAKERGEAAMKDKQPRLTRLERAFRHAAIRRRSQAERKAASSMSTTAE